GLAPDPAENAEVVHHEIDVAVGILGYDRWRAGHHATPTERCFLARPLKDPSGQFSLVPRLCASGRRPRRRARHRLDPGGDLCAGARAGHGAESARDLSRLDVLLQRFLLVLVFLNAPLDDVADRDQPNDAVAFEHGQMAELAIGHHFHDGGNGIALPAADDLVFTAALAGPA